MADRQHQQPHQVQVHTGTTPRYEIAGGKNFPGQHQGGGGPSMTPVLTVLTILPVGGTLLALAGLTLTGTVIGLCVATPLFVIFSPVIVPAGIAVFLAVAGFLSSGAFGLTGLSSLTYIFNRLRRATGTEQLDMDLAKRRVQDMAGYVGQKTKEVGQNIESRAREGNNRTAA